MQSKHPSFNFNTSIAFPISVVVLVVILLFALNATEKKQRTAAEYQLGDQSIALAQPVNTFRLFSENTYDVRQKLRDSLSV